MTKRLFPSPPWPSLPVEGEQAEYPVHRIFCVGKNYAAHAAEMGGEVQRDEPILFTKSALAFLDSGIDCPYPPGTQDYHHEVEMVVAISAPLFEADTAEAERAIYAYGVGLDMTRRDLQARLRENRLPWDIAKDVEQSAIIAPLRKATDWQPAPETRISLHINDALQQEGKLGDMVWSPAEILVRLSRLYHLMPGDLVMMGTPSGVGPVKPGDVLRGEIEGLPMLNTRFTDPE